MSPRMICLKRSEFNVCWNSLQIISFSSNSGWRLETFRAWDFTELFLMFTVRYSWWTASGARSKPYSWLICHDTCLTLNNNNNKTLFETAICSGSIGIFRENSKQEKQKHNGLETLHTLTTSSRRKLLLILKNFACLVGWLVSWTHADSEKYTISAPVGAIQWEGGGRFVFFRSHNVKLPPTLLATHILSSPTTRWWWWWWQW